MTKQQEKKIRALGLGPKAIDPRVLTLERKLTQTGRAHAEEVRALEARIQCMKDYAEDMKGMAVAFGIVALGSLGGALIMTALWLMK